MCLPDFLFPVLSSFKIYDESCDDDSDDWSFNCCRVIAWVDLFKLDESDDFDEFNVLLWVELDDGEFNEFDFLLFELRMHLLIY